MKNKIMKSAYKLGSVLIKNKKKMILALGAFLVGELYRLIGSKYHQRNSKKSKHKVAQNFSDISPLYSVKNKNDRRVWIHQGSMMKH